MVRKCYGGLVSRWILFLVLFFFSINNEYVEGRYISKRNYLTTPHRATVKTIESHEDGEIIDCVDIYSQPAFENPLIKTLQMEPSSYPDGSTISNRSRSQPELFQSWRRYGECPKGTVPCRRKQKHDFSQTGIDFGFHRKHHNISSNNLRPHEYAIGYLQGDFTGAKATMNVWNPKTESNDFSVSQIWLLTDDAKSPRMRSLEAGWIVSRGLYGDFTTRFFTYWTNDRYKSTGCYDLDCSGFVQTSRKFAVGARISPVSSYNGHTDEISIQIFKDRKTGNWWLQTQGETIGYWPRSIAVGDRAKLVEWGGEISNNSPGRHTTTQMGSGHFSSEKFGKSSFFRNLGVMDQNFNWIIPRQDSLRSVVTNPACYDMRFEPNESRFYYGGPGYNPKCT